MIESTLRLWRARRTRRTPRAHSSVGLRPEPSRSFARAFPDQALGRPTGAKRGAWSRRVLALALTTMVGFVALVGQLWYLQALEGSRLLELSDKNRIRIRPVAAPRGILFDRNGLPLVDNRPAFTLSLIPREIED